ncbi:acyltransferase family protein [Labrenzia sp. DG1229]|uniref:acyltransferase family protein n=1 Tax=Labrenzia sp. DG1229 TaxID=681847 RepID=UPI000490A426|nr:acyltransferase family protein [Labrenzia sp. DG1229]
MLTFTANYSHARPHAPAQTRNGSVDLLRFVGAIGIIQFHCGTPGHPISLAALPMFVILLVYFGEGRSLQGSARRLIAPWLIWSAIYAALKIAQSVVSGTLLSSEFAPWMLFAGTSIHLWFLPFAFVFLCACTKVPERITPAALWTLCLVLSAAVLWVFNTQTVPAPFMQWLAVIPAACAGLIMRRTQNALLPPAVLALSGFTALLLGIDGMTIQLAVAGLAVVLAMAVRLPQSALTDFLSDISFGLYLAHPAVLAAVLYVVPIGSPLLFPAVLTGSLAATLALRKVLPASV